MTKIKGTIQVTEQLYDILNMISEQKKNREPNGHLARFARLIDPVIIAAFFGLYKSQELPPLEEEEEIKLNNSYEFNVDISDFTDIFNHFLFCLWVKENGLPDKSEDMMKYRERLYHFVSKLLDDKYFLGVILPFYLRKADESEGESTSSFLHRLANSDDIGIVLQDYSPEFLAKEFSLMQSEFISNVIAPLGGGEENARKKQGTPNVNRKPRNT